MKKRQQDAGKPNVDVLENIRFEDQYTLRDKEAESLAHLYEVKVEQEKEEDKKDEYEILSIYSCNECVMHEGSSNKVKFSMLHKNVALNIKERFIQGSPVFKHFVRPHN